MLRSVHNRRRLGCLLVAMTFALGALAAGAFTLAIYGGLALGGGLYVILVDRAARRGEAPWSADLRS